MEVDTEDHVSCGELLVWFLLCFQSPMRYYLCCCELRRVSVERGGHVTGEWGVHWTLLLS